MHQDTFKKRTVQCISLDFTTVSLTMKTLLLLALAGFVLAVCIAVPFNEDDLESQEKELNGIAEDYGEEGPDER